MKKNYLSKCCAVITALIFSAHLFSQCNSCGTGVDGIFNATTNQTLTGATYNYSSFNINAGITVTVTGNNPLVINCTGNVTINGILTVSGGNGGNGVTFSTYGVGGVGVAGGANGGNGVYVGGPSNGQNGFGPGAGGQGVNWSGGGGAGYATNGASSGGTGGFGGSSNSTAQLVPLNAGSGGGGGSGGNSCGSGGGGAGGGIIQINCCGAITIAAGGSLQSNGGNGGSDGNGNCGGGGGGSGGTIWLSAPSIVNNGSMQANAGGGGSSAVPGSPWYGGGAIGSVGRIRVDGTLTGSGTSTPAVGFSGAAFSASITSTNVTCNGGNSGSATVTVSGGTSPYTYSWAPTGGTSATASGLAAGTYTCTIVDATSCSTTATVTITQPPVVGVTITSTNVSCNGGCNGTAMANPTGGTGTYTYLWSPGGGTSQNASGLCAGTYTCNVSSPAGCTAFATVIITQPTPLSSNTTVVPNPCNGMCIGSFTPNPSGGTPPYNFTPGTNLCAGTYMTTVTDANGCTVVSMAVITDPPPLFPSTSSTSVSCNGSCDGTATITVSGGTPGYTYDWIPGGQVTPTITNLCAGCYTCTVTDANGCTITQTVCITQPPALIVSFSSIDATCAMCNGSASVTPSGGTPGYTYLWSNAATTSSVNNLCAGVYTCTVTDANGCSTIITIVINNAASMTVNISSTDVSCFGLCDGSAAVNVSGGTAPYAFSWSPTSQTTATINNLCAGTYVVDVTDANGCTMSASVIITQPPLLTATSSSTNASTSSSNDGTLTGSASGGTPGYTYSWQPGSLVGASQTNIAPGTYTLTVCDANNCCDTSVAIVGVNSGIAANGNGMSVHIYPNPANENIQISLSLSSATNVRMEIFDVLGEKVDAVDLGTTVNVNYNYRTAALSNGIYFFRISSGKEVITKRVTISH
ncbi:MAG: T9SS type A sorting domain-containing protein [Bacteroidetes bacterium]|nr:T9SS type A sorting domain-containing protein [Bacteroidota bacterium]